MNDISRLSGKRAVPILRCSTKDQEDTSITDQHDSIKSFAQRHGMELGDPVEFVGSGSIKKNLDGLVDQVIDRKRRGEQIDVVAFFDQSRFGRSGSNHFGHLANRLENEGIELAETDAYINDSDTAGLVRSLKAHAAKSQAKNIAQASSRGSQASLKGGRRGHSTIPAYGIDKIYLTPDDEPICIVRRLADGSRQQLDPTTGEIKQVYPKGTKGYRKASLEKDSLVPGDPKRREIVIRIFRMHLEDDLGGTRIARLLNDEGVLSASGGKWNQPTIDAILRNEVYTGYGYANRFINAIYCNHADGMPTSVDGPSGRKTRGIRPSTDWHTVEYPALKNYLPENLLPRVLKFQAEYRDRMASGWIQNPKRSNGRRSYLLSRILTEKTTCKSMKAIKSGDSSRTYYGISGGVEVLPKNSSLRHRLPAPPLHRAVLDEIEALICAADSLRRTITQAIREQERERRDGAGEQAQLLAERDQLGKRYASQLSMLGGPDDQAVREAIAKTSKAIAMIDDRLAAINGGPALADEDIQIITNGIISDLRAMLEELAEDGDPALRKLAETLIGSAVADLGAGEVAFEFAIPSFMIEHRVMGLPHTSELASRQQAHKWNPILLKKTRVLLPPRCQGDCWNAFKPKGCDDCSRKGKAA